MKPILSFFQLIIALAIIVLILLQERSSGLSGIFGDSAGGFYQTRRGIEKTVFYTTIALVVLFAALSITNLVL